MQRYPGFSSLDCRLSLVLNDQYLDPIGRGLCGRQPLFGQAQRLAKPLRAVAISLEAAPDN